MCNPERGSKDPNLPLAGLYGGRSQLVVPLSLPVHVLAGGQGAHGGQLGALQECHVRFYKTL